MKIPGAEFEMTEIVVNPFSMHLSDSILSAHLAMENDSKARPEVITMFCRTSIAHAVFALEAAANSFIDKLPRNHRFRDQAEKWPMIEKFELCLLTSPGSPSLPKDNKIVTRLKALLKIRDRHVHPRSLRFPMKESPNEGVAFQLQWPGDHAINIPPVPFGLTPANAVTAIEVILDFLRLFLGLSGLTPAQTQMTLMGYVVCPDGNRQMDIGNFLKILNLAKSLSLDVSFFMPPNHVNS